MSYLPPSPSHSSSRLHKIAVRLQGRSDALHRSCSSACGGPAICVGRAATPTARWPSTVGEAQLPCASCAPMIAGRRPSGRPGLLHWPRPRLGGGDRYACGGAGTGSSRPGLPPSPPCHLVPCDGSCSGVRRPCGAPCRCLPSLTTTSSYLFTLPTSSTLLPRFESVSSPPRARRHLLSFSCSSSDGAPPLAAPFLRLRHPLLPSAAAVSLGRPAMAAGDGWWWISMAMSVAGGGVGGGGGSDAESSALG